MDGRSGDVTQPTCSKCGGPILTSKAGIKCARCDKVGAQQQPGGYQAHLKDGSIRYFDTERELTDFLGRKSPKDKKLAQSGVLPKEDLKVDQSGVGNLPSADIAFELIDKELNSVKFDTIAEAKKILSIRKKLNNLRFDVKTLLGGK